MENMETLNKMSAEISKLRAKEKSACAAATEEIRKKIIVAEANHRAALLKLNRQRDAQFREIADDIAEIVRLSFLMYVFGGADNKVELTHHVQWISFVDPETDSNFEFDKTRRYADTENGLMIPQPDAIKKAKKEIQEMYERYVGGDT